jgi:two-component system OmpR family sensor kinase
MGGTADGEGQIGAIGSMSVPATTGGQDATLEGAQSAPAAPARVAEHPLEADRHDRRVRDWLGAAGSARSRILISYVVLLALAATLGLFGFRQVLLIRLDDEVDDAMRQEVLELDLLLVDGRDPDTGRAFTSLRQLFDTYFARNVPSRGEAMLGFVEGELVDSSTLTRFPLDRLPGEKLSDWGNLGSRSPGEEGTATGRVQTELGDAHFRAQRIRIGDEVGAFVVTILPADEREEIAELLTYGGAAALGVLLIASACAWLIAGRVLRPVRLLTETAQSISQSDLTNRIEVRGAGEAADMARSFNAMLDRLEAVFRSQREFVQDTNHELRDPLTIVRGHLELLEEDPDERQRSVGLVLDELDRMGRIVDDLQLLAEVDQPGFLRVEWIDAGLFADELISKARALASRRWTLEHSGQGTFLADRHRLTEAVMNLAHNAVQHTTEDDTVAIGMLVSEDEVRMSVRDTGTGISVSDQSQIFERFTRGTGAHLRYRGGGLGLAIVRAVAEAHGGRVDLDSRLGEGSTFTIVVPRPPSDGAAGGQNSDR